MPARTSCDKYFSTRVMSTVLDMTGGENGSTSADKMNYCISNRFLENQPNEICSHLTEKASKAGFLNKPENGSKITVTKEKERRKRKSDGGDQERRRRKKSNGCTLSFYNELLWI